MTSDDSLFLQRLEEKQLDMVAEWWFDTHREMHGW